MFVLLKFVLYTFSVHFQAYLQKLISLEKKPYFYLVAVRCLCSLLDAAPHFNFRESLLASVVKNLSSSNDVARYILYVYLLNVFMSIIFYLLMPEWVGHVVHFHPKFPSAFGYRVQLSFRRQIPIPTVHV